MQRNKWSLVLTVPHPVADASPRWTAQSEDQTASFHTRPRSVSPTKFRRTSVAQPTSLAGQPSRPPSEWSGSQQLRPHTAQARVRMVVNDRLSATVASRRPSDLRSSVGSQAPRTTYRYYLHRGKRPNRQKSPLYLVQGISPFKAVSKFHMFLTRRQSTAVP